MPTVFVETLSKAIAEYRQMLRRHLPQSDRMKKLRALNLRNPDYDDEVGLYEIARRIIEDIDAHAGVHAEGYYAYSGLDSFCHYLKEFLAHYFVEGDCVVHRAQKASRALLESIQLMALPVDHLTSGVLAKIKTAGIVVARYGSKEQCALYRESVERYSRCHGTSFVVLVHHFDEQMARV